MCIYYINVDIYVYTNIVNQSINKKYILYMNINANFKQPIRRFKPKYSSDSLAGNMYIHI